MQYYADRCQRFCLPSLSLQAFEPRFRFDKGYLTMNLNCKWRNWQSYFPKHILDFIGPNCYRISTSKNYERLICTATWLILVSILQVGLSQLRQHNSGAVFFDIVFRCITRGLIFVTILQVGLSQLRHHNSAKVFFEIVSTCIWMI